jgi:O-antigen/teichoic acid export membrane protein
LESIRLTHPHTSLAKRLLKNIAAISAGQVVNILGNVALVPLFLSCWSANLYGEWMALSAVAAYITDFGMNSAAQNAMVAAYARGDLARYRFVQGSAMAFYVVMAVAGSLLFGGLVMVLPIARWIGVRQIPLATAGWVVWLVAVRTFWQMPSGQVVGIYRSMGNLAASQWATNLQAVGLLVVTAAALLFHGSVLTLSLWSCAPLVVITLYVWIDLSGLHSELLPKLSAARMAGIRELLHPSLMFGVIIIAMALAFQGPLLVVSGALGGVAVALLVTTRTLGNVIRQVVGTLTTALWPELTRMDATGAAESLRVSHRLLAAVSVAACAAFAGALWFEGAEVIRVWTRGKLTPDVWLLRWLLISLVLQAAWLASSAFTISSNRHRNLAYSYFGSAIVAVAATALLIRPLGLPGVPLASIAGDGLACYHFVIKDTCSMLGESYPRYAARLWMAVGAVSLAAWGAAWLGHAMAFGPAPLRWMETGVLSAAAAGLSAWGLALRAGDRSLLMRWGKSRWAAAPLVRVESAV